MKKFDYYNVIYATLNTTGQLYSTELLRQEDTTELGELYLLPSEILGQVALFFICLLKTALA